MAKKIRQQTWSGRGFFSVRWMYGMPSYSLMSMSILCEMRGGVLWCPLAEPTKSTIFIEETLQRKVRRYKFMCEGKSKG
jgi:hypothetical protein